MRTATASASGIEWFTATNSQLELADRDLVAVGDDRVAACPRKWCSRSFSASSARVSLDPISGMSRSLAEQVRHGADVVFMAVGEHQADHVVEPLADGVEARQDQVDAGMIILGEQHPQSISSSWPSNSTTAMLRPTSPDRPRRRCASHSGPARAESASYRQPREEGYRPDSIAAVGAASGEPLAASVRLAWPDEASNIASLQRRSWAVQWPADLAELMLNVGIAGGHGRHLASSDREAARRPRSGFLSRPTASESSGFATTMPNQDEDADR